MLTENPADCLRRPNSKCCRVFRSGHDTEPAARPPKSPLVDSTSNSSLRSIVRHIFTTNDMNPFATFA